MICLHPHTSPLSSPLLSFQPPKPPTTPPYNAQTTAKMVIAHTGIVCAESLVPALLKFYTHALAPLGYRKVISFRDDLVHGFGDAPGQVDWWVSAAHEKIGGEAGAVVASSHHAFVAKGLFFPVPTFCMDVMLTQWGTDRATVEAFHKAALEAGGKDNGAPGVRARYGPKYFAAYILDPVGNNIEAMVNGGE